MTASLDPLVRRCIVVGFAAMVAACGGNKGSGADTGPAGPGARVDLGHDTLAPALTVGTEGGTVHGATGSAAEGVAVKFAPGTTQTPVRVSVGTNDGKVTPGAGVWDGRIFTIETDYGIPFEDAAEVTLPFAKRDGYLPVPYYIDASGKLQACQLLSVDSASGTLRLHTWHASRFTVVHASLDVASTPPAPATFDPARNGFQVGNEGTKYNQAGECLGMAAFAQWYWNKYGNSPGLYNRYMYDVPPNLKGQHVIASRAFISIQRYADQYVPRLAAQISLTPAQVFASIKGALQESGPQIVGFSKRLLSSGPANHAVLAYGVDGNDLLLYDPNFNRETKRHHFDGASFKGYPAIAFGVSGADEYTQTLSLGNGSFQAEDFGHIDDDAQLGFVNADARIMDVQPAAESHVSDRFVNLTGRVEDSLVLVEELRVILDSQTYQTKVNLDGTFSVTVPLTSGSNRLYPRVYGRDRDNRLVPIKSNYDNGVGHRIYCDAETSTMLITLTWDQAVDLDLYVTDPAGSTAWYSSKKTSDGGELDRDNTSGYGPEHFTLTSSATTRYGRGYLVKVHKYTRGDKFTKWAITASLNEGPPQTFTGTLTAGDPSNAGPGGTGSDWSGFFEITPVRSK